MKSVWSLAVASLILCGCGGASSRPPQVQTIPIKGIVSFDGRPLAGAAVTFMAGDPPMVCAGRTNDDGSYELLSLAGRDAAMQGACKVTISRLVKADGSLLAAEEAPANTGALEQLPPKYSRAEYTSLSANVPAGGGTFDFALTSN